jgi:ADP-ribosylglycohydrolase
MLPDPAILTHLLRWRIRDLAKQGHDIAGLDAALDGVGRSYDALDAFATRLAALPLRADWPWHEPSDLAGIRAAWDADGLEPVAVDPATIAPRIEAAFLASCCGCVLGKPLEVDPTLAEIRAAAEAVGEWPLRGYVSEGLLERLGRRHGDWVDTTAGRIAYVARDDDLCYSILGMTILERHGDAFTTADVARAWFMDLPAGWCWGPESQVSAQAAAFFRYGPGLGLDPAAMEWGGRWIAGGELCGALIRVAAYGYACAGDPRRAAELAWRDAALTHRRTGLYGAMFTAAAIAAAFTASEPLEAFRRAARVVPRRSRFRDVVERSIDLVAGSSDWLDGYQRIHGTFAEHRHCQIHQEIGTLMNTLRWATDVGDGLGKQVAQGNDTDSFGCTAGSLLGAYFGPGRLEARWLEPFGDRILTALATFGEQRLSAVAARMGRLPLRLASEPARTSG